jgi:hypothetical protein
MDRIDKFPKHIFQIPLDEDHWIYKFIWEVPLNAELIKKHNVKTVFVQDYGCKKLKWVIGCSIDDASVFEYLNKI